MPIFPWRATISGAGRCLPLGGACEVFYSSSSFIGSPQQPQKNAGPAATSRDSFNSSAAGSDDDDDNSLQPADSSSLGKPLRVERLLANLGYGRRKECMSLVKQKRLLYASSGQPAKVGEKALAGELLLDGEQLDPAPPLTLLLHKPVGFVVTSPEDENVLDSKIYDLLPYRFGRRKPFLSAVGRLDKETSGLLLMTDDGKLLHSIQSPARGIWKRYRAQLAAPLVGSEAAAAVRLFASGRMMLQGDRSPLLPACLTMTNGSTAEVAICEGRYHQIRRMFAAVGHQVVGLHRHTIGGLQLDGSQVPEGSWRLATADDVSAVLSGPDLQEMLLQQQEGDPAAEEMAAVAQPACQDQRGHLRKGDADGEFEDEEDLDFEEEQEQARYSRTFRNSSRWARRRAVMARSVAKLKSQQQQQQGLQQFPAVSDG
eukprot:gene3328-3605_t